MSCLPISLQLIQRVSPQGAKNSDVVSIIIHCFDVRQIKLIFIHGTRSLLPQGVSGRDQFYAAKHTTKRDVFEGLIDEDSDGESDFIILSMTSSKSIPKKATDIDNTDKEDVTPNGQTSKAHDGHVTEKPSSFQKRAFSASDLEGYNERSLEENYEVADSTHVNPRRTVNDPLSFSSRKKVPSEKKDLGMFNTPSLILTCSTDTLTYVHTYFISLFHYLLFGSCLLFVYMKLKSNSLKLTILLYQY